MKLKGDWDSTVTYSVGNVVRFTDGNIYHLQRPCDAGVPPVNTLYWGMLGQDLAAAVCLILDAVEMVMAKVPTNINDEAIVLKGTDDAEYLVTVDDSGETPELSVELIEEESGGD